MSRPAFSPYIADPQQYRRACAELFDLVQRGVLTLAMNATYALRDAAQAHRDVEARKTSGSVVLIP